MAISKKVRFEVFKRDAFTCQYCGRTPPAVVLQADHIHPVSKGGTDDEENLITSCFDCNSGKSDRLLAQVIPPLEKRKEMLEERQAQVEAYNAFLDELRQKEDETIDELGQFWFNLFCEEKNRWCFGASRVASVRTFLKSLPATVLKDAMEHAVSRKGASLDDDGAAFRYFCGICWNKIKGR